MTFTTVWNDIQSRLKPGTDIKGWGAERGYTGMKCKVTGVSRVDVTVTSDTISTPRTIGRQEFEKLFAVWDDYCDRRLERQRVAAISQNSSYVFSIFRWLAESPRS
jgi:hypothetical protein